MSLTPMRHGPDGFPVPHLPTDRPLRILVGPWEIAGQIPDFAAGFRALGHQVTTVIAEVNSFFPDLTYDVDLKANQDPGLISHLINSHDVFVFQFGVSLLPGNADLPAIRGAGKAVIMVFNGDDVRHSSGYSQEFGVPVEPLGEFYINDPVARPLQALRIGERFATMVVSVPNQSSLALRPYQHFAYPLDLGAYGPPMLQDRERPVVVHAPSNKAAKGTGLILAALERIRDRGVPFDLQLLEKAPHSQVCDALRNADMAVDQLFLPFGKYAAEAMALGCAVAVAHFPQIEPAARLRPLAGLSLDSYETTLEQLITDRAWRRQLAEAGPAYARATHDRVTVCARIIDALRLEVAGTLQHDYYPTFALQRYRLPASTELPMFLRTLGSDIVRRWGAPADTDLEAAARRGLIAAHTFDGATIPSWTAEDGLAAHTGDALRARWTAMARPESAPRTTRTLPAGEATLVGFHTLADGIPATLDTAESQSLIVDMREYQQLGMPHVGTPRLMQSRNPALRLAAALHRLGAGDPARCRR